MKQQILQAALDRLRGAVLDYEAARENQDKAPKGAAESEATATTLRTRAVLDRETDRVLIDDIYGIWRK